MVQAKNHMSPYGAMRLTEYHDENFFYWILRKIKREDPLLGMGVSSLITYWV